MKRKLISITIILLITFSAYCTNLVGFIQGFNSYYNSYYPFSNAYIELQYWNGTRWINGTYTYSGSNGYYYFNNIKPGYYYNLKINNTYNYQIFIKNTSIQYLQKITLK